MGVSAFRSQVAAARARAAIAANTIPGGADDHTEGGGTAGRVVTRRRQTFSQIIAETTRGVDGEGRGAGAPAGQMGPQRLAARGGQICETKVGGDPVSKTFNHFIKAESIDTEHGIVFGWGIICKENGVDYVDVQKDHIPEESMLEAAADFAAAMRPGNEMHADPEVGQHIFLFPLTTDVAKALDITTKRTGLLLGYKPPPDVLAKFKSGAYTGFSIEGQRIHDKAAE